MKNRLKRDLLIAAAILGVVELVVCVKDLLTTHDLHVVYGELAYNGPVVLICMAVVAFTWSRRPPMQRLIFLFFALMGFGLAVWLWSTSQRWVAILMAICGLFSLVSLTTPVSIQKRD